MPYSESELIKLRRQVRQKRKALKMTQNEAAREIGISPRSFSSLETGSQPVSDQIVESIARFVADQREELGFVTNKKLTRIEGPVGPQANEPLIKLDSRNLEVVADILVRTGADLVCDISTDVSLLGSEGVTKHLKTFDTALTTLMAKPGKEVAPVKSAIGFGPVLERQKSRQEAARNFADAVPKELLGRLYGAFVTARVDEGETSVFYLILGADENETWELEFTAPADPATLKRMREFNEDKLIIDPTDNGRT